MGKDHDHKDPRSPNRFLVVEGILEVYHQLQLPPFSPVSPPGTNPLPCEHHRGRSLTYNLKDKRSDPYHLISNIKANAETRDDYHLALFFQSTAQPLKRESSPPLKTKLQILRNTSCSRVTLSFCRAFKRKVGRAAFRTPPTLLRAASCPPLETILNPPL
jgi:hypothetical protein